MKFSIKNADLINGLKPVLLTSNTGVMREYLDAGKITIEATADGLNASTHNGNAAITNANCGGESYMFSSAGEAVTIKTVDLERTLGAFGEKEILAVSVEGTEVIFRPASNGEDYQTIPVEVRAIKMPL